MSKPIRAAALAAGLAALAVLAGRGGVLDALAPGARAAPADDGPAIEAIVVAPDDLLVPGRTGRPDRRVTIDGRGFFGTSFGPFVRFVLPDGRELQAEAVALEGATRVVAWPPRGIRGPVEVIVENPDRRSVVAPTRL